MHATNSNHDLIIAQKENEKKYSQVDDEKQFYKGIIIALPIAIALWCIIFSLAIVIY